MASTDKTQMSVGSQSLADYFSRTGYTRKIDKGTYLFSENQPADELYMIQSGNIKVGKVTDDGKEISFRLCKKGDIIGELTLYSGSTIHFTHAQVINSGTVIAIRKFDLEKELLTNHSLTIEYMKMVSILNRRDQTLFRDLMLYGKKGALYSTLIRLANTYGEQQDKGIFITLSLTNQELADFCGTTRESVNRLLSVLRKEGVISTNGGHIIVHNLHYLKAGVNCEYCPFDSCTIN